MKPLNAVKNIFTYILIFPVIWKEHVVLVVGAAFSRDHLISRLPATSSAESEAAPTGVFLW
jgi:hypothetical protein